MNETILLSPQGEWDADETYTITVVYPTAAIGVLYVSSPLVTYAGGAYYVSGTVQPTPGVPPTSEPSIWLPLSHANPNQLTPCAVATTANIALTGEQTIDGVLTSASRVLVKNQTLSQNNGIYTTGAGAWTRTTDANSWGELVGASVFITGGSTQMGYNFISTIDAGGVLGTTPITFEQNGQSTVYLAGNGLDLTGTTFSIESPVSIANGGTGAATANASFNALSPMTTLGDIVYGGVAGAGTRLAGNATATAYYLKSLGNGAIAAAPVFSQIAYADISGTPALGTAAALNSGTATNNVIQWSGTSTYPAGNGTAITNIATSVNIAAGVANDIPYQTAANTTAFIAPANNAVLASNGSGVPAWQTTVPTVNIQTTPTFIPADASGAALVFSAVSENCKRTGDLIWFTLTVTYPVTVDGSPAIISGLPVASAGAIRVLGSVSVSNAISPANQHCTASITGTQIAIINANGNGAIHNTDLSGSVVVITGVYSAS